MMCVLFLFFFMDFFMEVFMSGRLDYCKVVIFVVDGFEEVEFVEL